MSNPYSNQPPNPYGMPPQGHYPPPANIPNYLVQSILVTLFCCLPFGIVAIVFAAQVNGKLQSGDIQGAMQASSQAKMWCWISLGLWAVGAVLYVGLIILGALAGGMN